jgi:hypothetical protein
VREQQSLFGANEVLIEDKASGTQLIQELITDGCHGVTRYQPTCDNGSVGATFQLGVTRRNRIMPEKR